MSGGLGDFFGPKFTATPKGRIRNLADYLAIFSSDPILYAPGTSRRYSNAGYVVLGLIIEKVSGKSYYDYVREHIYGPAGMKDSDSYFQDAIVANRAVGYTLEDEDEKQLPQAVSNMYMLPARGSSAGGGYSTAEDLLRFDLAMRGGKLLGPAGVAWFYSDQSISPARRRPAAASLVAAAESPAGPPAQTPSSRWTSTRATRWSCSPTSIRPRPRRSPGRCVSGWGSTDPPRHPAQDSSADRIQRYRP